MRMWGIRIGEGCTFEGMPIVRRYPGSSVSVGGNCAFISTTHGNAIGVNHPCAISTHNSGARIEIGDKCGFSGTTIGCACHIRIGNRVKCGANTTITDTDWHPEDARSSPDEPVVIEDDVWLGLNVTVLKGVTIGCGSVVGAGSVVTHSIPPHVIAGGVPARVIRQLQE